MPLSYAAQRRPHIAIAKLTKIREQGYALNKGENEPSLGAVSVPVESKERGVLLTLSTFGMLSRFNDEFVEKAVARLKRAAIEIQTNTT